MVAGRSAAALRTWLGARDQAFRDRVKIVSMDGFTGYHRAAKDVLPQARTVMDPFHVVQLGCGKVDRVPAADSAGHTRASRPLR